MGATSLNARPIEKVWGRQLLPAGFSHLAGAAPVGEVWFEPAGGHDQELLIKYLFTSQRLSIQVHPGDEEARAQGHACGKDEAWLVLDAAPGAVIGLGLTRAATREELREAALSGEIEQLIDWRPVKAGDFLYSPAGTVHAIGPGLSLIEIQQNCDLTYRLYDYGRPRELHLDDAVEVAELQPCSWSNPPVAVSAHRTVLASGGAFVIEEWAVRAPVRLRSRKSPVLVIPTRGSGRIDGSRLDCGSVWSVEGEANLASGRGMKLLVAYPGPDVVPQIARELVAAA